MPRRVTQVQIFRENSEEALTDRINEFCTGILSCKNDIVTGIELKVLDGPHGTEIFIALLRWTEDYTDENLIELSEMSGVSVDRIEHARITSGEWELISKAAKKISESSKK